MDSARDGSPLTTDGNTYTVATDTTGSPAPVAATTRTSVPAAGSVTIASGIATGDITWKSDNVWNNNGDTAYLYDGSGRLISQKKG